MFFIFLFWLSCYILNFILKVVDCRICGDPHSVLRFAFIEFSDEGKYIWLAFLSWICMNHTCHTNKHAVLLIDGARAALNLGGTMLGYYPLRVLPSKTAILPVNPKFLPRVSIFYRFMYSFTCRDCLGIRKKVRADCPMLLHFIIFLLEYWLPRFWCSLKMRKKWL